MDSNKKNFLALAGFIIVFILDLLLSNDYLQAMLLGLLAAFIIEMVGNKFTQKSVNEAYSHAPVRKDYQHINKIEHNPLISRPSTSIPNKTDTPTTNETSSKSLIQWKAIFIGLAITILFLIGALISPSFVGEGDLTDEAAIIFTLLIMGIIALGGVITGYLSGYNYTRGLINGIIYGVILGLLMALMDPIMLIFVPMGLLGGVIGVLIKNLVN